MRQLIFRKDYVEELRQKVKNNDVSLYHCDAFEYNNEATFATNIERRDDLLQIMLENAVPEKDYEAAIALYEAFPNLTLEQAYYDPFWAYLTHVDLYPYMIKRFCGGNAPSEKDVKNHWWYTNLMRRGISNLWWSVHQTIDPNHETDKYHYTKYFFKHIDFRQRRMGSSTLFRLKEAVIGILKFLEENVTEYFEGRANFIIMYFNKQATLRQLAVYDRNDFYNELDGIKEDILSVKHRTEAADAVNLQEDDLWLE
jgi:hypothetical protein